jgi:phosphoglycerate kinase
MPTKKTVLPKLTDIKLLRGTRVLVRASLNVPLVDGQVRNSFRVKRALPTLNFLRNAGAKVIVIAHIGRETEDSLAPVATEMQTHLPLTFVSSHDSQVVENAVSALREGEVLLLENLRQNEGEKKNDEAFANTLASYADVYVNDAFAASHRAHASLVGVPRFLPSYFGFNFLHEYEELTKALQPQSPSLFILGGAKFETKMPLIEKFAAVYDTVFVGGALANDFYKAKGYETGQSLVSPIDLRQSPLLANKKIILPNEVMVRGKKGDRVTTPDAVTEDETILDASESCLKVLDTALTEAAFILWNGPLGDYEQGFTEGTEALAKRISAAKGYSVIGGGDTIAAVEKFDTQETFGFMSTGGGAMLTFLEEGTLPAIEAVMKKRT